MFLQRNTASQTFVLPGTLRLIADGSAVTSGATLTWVKDGTSGAAAGTLTHISDGSYSYQPSQSETDGKILGWVLSKTGAAGLAGSVRTTNADPNDGAALGLTRIDAAVSSRMATFTLPTNFALLGITATGHISTVDTLTTLPSIPNNWLTAAGIASGALNGKGDWLLASSAPTNWSSLSISVGGKVAATMGSTDYAGNTVQTGDSFARIGATGSGLTSLAPASTALSTAQWTNTRAANLDNLDAPVSGCATQGSVNLQFTNLTNTVNNLNNLSALANLFGPSVMVRPAAGSIAYALTLTIRDSEGHLVDLDALPTLAAANAAGTDRSANFSAVTHASTGVYTFSYTVHSTDPDEGIRANATGTVSSSARRADLNWSVADADNLAALAAIQAQTDRLTFDGSGYLYSHAKVNDDKTAYSLTTAEESAIATAVWASGTRTLSSFAFALTTTVGGYSAGQDPATLLAASGSYLAAVAGAVWAALTSGMTTLNSIGKKLADWVLGSDHKAVLSVDETGAGLTAIPGSSPAAIASAVWTTDLSTGYSGNEAGAMLKGAGVAGNPWAATTPYGVTYAAAFEAMYTVTVPAQRVDSADHSTTSLWQQGQALNTAAHVTSTQTQTEQTVTVH